MMILPFSILAELLDYCALHQCSTTFPALQVSSNGGGKGGLHAHMPLVQMDLYAITHSPATCAARFSIDHGPVGLGTPVLHYLYLETFLHHTSYTCRYISNGSSITDD